MKYSVSLMLGAVHSGYAYKKMASAAQLGSTCFFLLSIAKAARRGGPIYVITC